MSRIGFVTGAYGGIGSMVVDSMIDEGMKVFCVGRNEEKLLKIKSKYSGNVEIGVADCRFEKDIQKMVDACVKTLGAFDVVVHCVGKYTIRDAFEYNVKSAMLVYNICNKKMIEENNGGRLIFFTHDYQNIHSINETSILLACSAFIDKYFQAATTCSVFIKNQPKITNIKLTYCKTNYGEKFYRNHKIFRQLEDSSWIKPCNVSDTIRVLCNRKNSLNVPTLCLQPQQSPDLESLAFKPHGLTCKRFTGGKCAVITGASKGMGRFLSLHLASRGFDVVLIARSEKLLHDIENEIKSKYRVNVLTLPGDMCNSTLMKKHIKTIFNTFGTITVLINNAIVSGRGYIHSRSDKTIETTVNVNLTSQFLFIRNAIKIMIENQNPDIKPTIINFGSYYSSIINERTRSLYYSTKNSMRKFLDIVRNEYRDSNLQVSSLSLGVVEKSSSLTSEHPILPYSSETSLIYLDDIATLVEKMIMTSQNYTFENVNLIENYMDEPQVFAQKNNSML